jgi:hypothetical protein
VNNDSDVVDRAEVIRLSECAAPIQLRKTAPARPRHAVIIESRESLDIFHMIFYATAWPTGPGQKLEIRAGARMGRIHSDRLNAKKANQAFAAAVKKGLRDLSYRNIGVPVFLDCSQECRSLTS